MHWQHQSAVLSCCTRLQSVLSSPRFICNVGNQKPPSNDIRWSQYDCISKSLVILHFASAPAGPSFDSRNARLQLLAFRCFCYSVRPRWCRNLPLANERRQRLEYGSAGHVTVVATCQWLYAAWRGLSLKEKLRLGCQRLGVEKDKEPSWRTFRRASAEIFYTFRTNSFACPWEFWRIK